MQYPETSKIDVHKIKVGEGGRMVIPAVQRKALGIKTGDELCAYVKDGQLRLYSLDQALKKLQDLVKHHKPSPGSTHTDDFIAFRKLDSGE